MGLTLSSSPAVEPVSAADVRTWGQIASTTGEYADAVLNERIKAARELVEARARIILVTQTWLLTLDGFGDCGDWGEVIYLPLYPLQSITSVQYVDTAGTTQALASSVYRFDAAEARLALEYGQVWPPTRDVIKAVTITYKAGYGDLASDCPAMAREAILEIVEDRIKNRGGVYQIPNGALEKIRSLWSGRL